MSLNISASLLALVHSHAESAYPYECCGAFIGASDAESKTVHEVYSLENAEPNLPERRFVIDPAELNALDKRARLSGHDVIGFYHSHPDSRAKPSATDLKWAWHEYSYVIVSVLDSRAADTNCFVLSDVEGEKQFVSEDLIVTAE